MKIIFPVFALFTAILILSCGGEKKQSQSNVTNSIDEETKFAQTLYGEKSTVLAKGDLLSNGKPCAIAGIIRQKTDNNFWIEKASFFQKEGNDWKVLLKLEEKLTSPKGELTSQVEAKNGYIISFDTTKKPITINIVMANEYGKGASDDAVIKWDTKKNDFVFLPPYEEIPQ